MNKINLAEKYALIDEHWCPKVVAELNGQEVKLVKFQGAFVWHHHDDADEMFLVWRGRMRVVDRLAGADARARIARQMDYPYCWDRSSLH